MTAAAHPAACASRTGAGPPVKKGSNNSGPRVGKVKAAAAALVNADSLLRGAANFDLPLTEDLVEGAATDFVAPKRKACRRHRSLLPPDELPPSKAAAAAYPSRRGASRVPINKKNQIFVGNVPRFATEESVRDVFTRFGRVEDVVLMRRPSGSTNFGFVIFKTNEEATRAVSCTEGIRLGDDDCHVLRVELRKDGNIRFGSCESQNRCTGFKGSIIAHPFVVQAGGDVPSSGKPKGPYHRLSSDQVPAETHQDWLKLLGSFNWRHSAAKYLYRITTMEDYLIEYVHTQASYRGLVSEPVSDLMNRLICFSEARPEDLTEMMPPSISGMVYNQTALNGPRKVFDVEATLQRSELFSFREGQVFYNSALPRAKASEKLCRILVEGLFIYFFAKFCHGPMFKIKYSYYQRSEPIKSTLMTLTGQSNVVDAISAYFDLFRQIFIFQSDLCELRLRFDCFHKGNRELFKPFLDVNHSGFVVFNQNQEENTDVTRLSSAGFLNSGQSDGCLPMQQEELVASHSIGLCSSQEPPPPWMTSVVEQPSCQQRPAQTSEAKEFWKARRSSLSMNEESLSMPFSDRSLLNQQFPVFPCSTSSEVWDQNAASSVPFDRMRNSGRMSVEEDEGCDSESSSGMRPYLQGKSLSNTLRLCNMKGYVDALPIASRGVIVFDPNEDCYDDQLIRGKPVQSMFAYFKRKDTFINGKRMTADMSLFDVFQRGTQVFFNAFFNDGHLSNRVDHPISEEALLDQSHALEWACSHVWIGETPAFIDKVLPSFSCNETDECAMAVNVLDSLQMPSNDLHGRLKAPYTDISSTANTRHRPMPGVTFDESPLPDFTMAPSLNCRGSGSARNGNIGEEDVGGIKNLRGKVRAIITKKSGFIRFTFDGRTEDAYFVRDQVYINGSKIESPGDLHNFLWEGTEVFFDAEKQAPMRGVNYRASLVWTGPTKPDIAGELLARHLSFNLEKILEPPEVTQTIKVDPYRVSYSNEVEDPEGLGGSLIDEDEEALPQPVRSVVHGVLREDHGRNIFSNPVAIDDALNQIEFSLKKGRLIVGNRSINDFTPVERNRLKVMIEKQIRSIFLNTLAEHYFSKAESDEQQPRQQHVNYEEGLQD